MPTVSNTTTITLPAGQVAIFELGGKGTANVDPARLGHLYTIGAQEAFFGPYDRNVSIAITPVSPVSYRIDSDGDISNQAGSLKNALLLGSSVIISAEAPSDGDGRPDGTIYIQTA